MFEFLPKDKTRSVQFVALPPDRLVKVWECYMHASEEERFAMFKSLTGGAVYSITDSIITARLMAGLMGGGMPGYLAVVGDLLNELAPNAEAFTEEDFDRLLSE